MAERVRRLLTRLRGGRRASNAVTRGHVIRYRVVCRLCGRPTLLAPGAYLEAQMVTVECGGCARELVAVITLSRTGVAEPSWYGHLDRDDLPAGPGWSVA